MARRGSGYMTVDVDLYDALQSVDDEMLLTEMKERKLNLGRADFEPVDDLLSMLVRNSLRGRPAEALAILERLINPKWHCTEACEAELARAKA